jgi:hypothetical protein
MNHKKALYAALPLLGIGVVLGGVSLASAHGISRGNILGLKGSHGDPTEMFQHEAALLGISVDEVKNAWAQGKDMQALLKEKGISEESLRAKIKVEQETKMKEHLASLVASGKLTQAQADEMTARHAAEELNRETALASALGISVNDLEAYQKAGKSIEAIITEKGLNKDTVFAVLRDAHLAVETANIQALVSKGVLTQDQANKRIETIKTQKASMPHKGEKPRGGKPGFFF